MKKCPYCAEEIQEEAIVCRFCGKDLTGKSQVSKVNSIRLDELVEARTKAQADYDKARSSRTTGLLGLLIGILLGLTIHWAIGVFLGLAGLLAAMTQGGKASTAKMELAKIESEIALLRQNEKETT